MKYPAGRLIFVFLFCAVVFVTALGPINAYDFFWHLKTGEYLLQFREFPEVDPFTTTATSDDPEFPGRPSYLLKQYWLAQVVYAAVVHSFGLQGIILFRGFLYLAMALLVFLVIRKKGADRWSFIALSLFALAVRVALEDTDRPQFFAFFFAFLVIFITEISVQGAKKRLLYLTIPCIVLAANMHAGFIVPVMYTLLYAGCSFFEERLKTFRKVLVISSVLGAALSWFNPTHWQVFDAMFRMYNPALDSSALIGSFSEYRSPFAVFPHVTTNIGWMAFWVLTVLSLPAILYQAARKNFSLAAITLLTLGASLYSMRFIFFFLPVGTVTAALLLQNLPERKPPVQSWIKAAASVILVFIVILRPFHENQAGIKVILPEGLQPVLAAEFMSEEDLPQPVFNDIQFGGYLTWRLWPKYKMFIDTRALTVGAYRDYLDMIRYTPEGKQALNSYGISTIVTPAVLPYTGEIVPLVRGLYNDPVWSLVYADGQAMIFTRSGIRREELPKKMVYEEVLREIQRWWPSFPWLKEYEASRDEAVRALLSQK